MLMILVSYYFYVSISLISCKGTHFFCFFVNIFGGLTPFNGIVR